MYKKSNLFVYKFVVGDNIGCVYPIKLKIDMLYHMNSTFRKTIF